MNKKKITKVWVFQSGSNPSKTYETLQYEDNTTSCECPGWTRRAQRTCKHTRSVDMGTADTECIAMKDYAISNTAPQQQPQTAQTAKPKKKTPKKLKIKEDTPTAIVRKINW